MFNISLYTTNEIWRIKNESFERGEKHGREMAVEELRNTQRYNCVNLTQEEKDEVMKYLVDNNLEFGYNVESGFYIVKKRK
jgi:uncharacterized FlaG/YvyC family protein